MNNINQAIDNVGSWTASGVAAYCAFHLWGWVALFIAALLLAIGGGASEAYYKRTQKDA